MRGRVKIILKKGGKEIPLLLFFHRYLMENFKQYQNSFPSVRLYIYFPKEKELRSYGSLLTWSYFLFLQKRSPLFCVWSLYCTWQRSPGWGATIALHQGEKPSHCQCSLAEPPSSSGLSSGARHAGKGKTVLGLGWRGSCWNEAAELPV